MDKRPTGTSLVPSKLYTQPTIKIQQHCKSRKAGGLRVRRAERSVFTVYIKDRAKSLWGETPPSRVLQVLWDSDYPSRKWAELYFNPAYFKVCCVQFLAHEDTVGEKNSADE